MFGMKTRIMMDPKKVEQAKKRAERRFLYKGGWHVRKIAQASIKSSPTESAPGEPPHTRKRNWLRRSILYGVELAKNRVVIGTSSSMIGEGGAAHELGEEYHERKYPKRPFMGPALIDAQPELVWIWRDSVK
jgi:hypothetical protein